MRHGDQYELTLHAETLGVGAAKLPNLPEDVSEAFARLHERATQIRTLIETLDLLYDAFGVQRFGKAWPEMLPRMQKWLAKGEGKEKA